MCSQCIKFTEEERRIEHQKEELSTRKKDKDREREGWMIKVEKIRRKREKDEEKLRKKKSRVYNRDIGKGR